MKKLFGLRGQTLWLVAVWTTGICFTSYLVLRFETMRIGYEVAHERAEHDRLTANYRLMSLEVQSLRERQRIGTIAARSLGMGAPDVGRVITVDGAGASRTLGSRRAR